MADVHRAKLTKRTVDGAAPPTSGESKVWDTDLKGFVLRVHSTGRKVYAVRYRHGSHQATFTIGTHGSPWTPDAAREAARDVLEKVRRGEDPGAERKAVKAAPNVGELIDAYLLDGPVTKPAKRASTWREDGANLNRHLRPQLGRRTADAVTKAEAARAIHAVGAGATAVDERTRARGRARVTGGPQAARRTRATSAAMYAWGIKHGLVKTNPFAGVKLAAPAARERFFSREEASRFIEALAALELEGAIAGVFADALRLLLLTGARKTEILGLQWPEVDFGRSRLTLPPDRTKAGGKTGERRIMLSPPALSVLERRRTTAEARFAEVAAAAKAAGAPPPPLSRHVFPAAKGSGHAVGIRRGFVRVAERAKLGAVRVHDLRHSFASFAVADGASLFLVGKLLGHASSRTTERYAHLSADPLAEVAALVGRRIMPDRDAGGSVITLSEAHRNRP